MTDRTQDTSAAARPSLDDIAKEKGDPRLFPREVVRLHQQGEARKAQRELLRHAAKAESDPRRAEKQRAAAAELRLWLDPCPKPPTMYVLNGFGTRFLGSHQPGADGTFIGTLWITLLFVPVFPLAAYLVAPADKGWYFLAKAPLPPRARTGRRVAGLVAAALTVAAAAFGWWATGHAGVIAYNGFDQPVTVTVGGASQAVPPRQHVIFDDVPTGRVSFVAAWAGGAGAGSFESTEVDLSGHGTDRVIYNVGSRAVLVVSTVTYGTAALVPDRVLDPGPVLFEERLDHLFSNAPDSVSVSAGGGARRLVLHASDAGSDVSRVLMDLLGEGHEAQARAVARAELLAHPEDANVVWILARRLLRDHPDSQLALVRASLRRSPEAVDLHRLYQEVREGDAAAVRAEYDSLYAANPGSAMYAFLAGRAQADGSDAALERYRAALRLDPDYGPVHRALAFHAVTRGDWAGALASYDRFAALDKGSATESIDDRLRLRRRLGRPAGEFQALIAAHRQLQPNAFWPNLLEAHIRLERDPARLAVEVDTLLRRAAALWPVEAVRDAVGPNLRAIVAVTAGDLDGARAALRAVAAAGDRDVDTATRIALSAGATAEDAELLRAIPRWFAHLDPFYQPAALQLLPAAERAAAVRELDPDVAALVALVDDAARITRTAALDSALATTGLRMRAAMHLAAALRLTREDAPEARRARATYLAQARALALPGELPYLGR